jgi:hypothetical protein
MTRDWFPINCVFLGIGYCSLISAYFLEEDLEWQMIAGQKD